MVFNLGMSLHYRVEYKTGKGALSQKLYEVITGIQTGRLEDKKGWTMEIN